MTSGKEMFLNHLYGGMDEPEQKIIDVFMCKLRKSSPTPRAAKTILKPCGAAATHCGILRAKKQQPRCRLDAARFHWAH